MTTTLIIALQLVLLVLLIRQVIITILAMWTGYFSDVPFHQTKTRIIDQVSKIVREHEAPVFEAPVFIELGSGAGRVSIGVAKQTKASITAVEKNWPLFKLSQLKSKLAGVDDQIRWLRKDLFKAKLEQADVVYLYLSPLVNQKLTPKLEKVLKPGANVISWKFLLESKMFKKSHKLSTKQLHVYTKVS